jgi:hypothetical protein
MRRVLGGVVAGSALTCAATAIAAGPWPGTYAWFNGDAQAGIGRLGSALSAFSLGDFNLHAHHVRIESEDGNIELESGKGAETTTLNPYFIGTATRKPLQVGWPDGKDVLPFIVTATPGQKKNIQEWRAGSKTVAAMNAKGQLRLGSITLAVQLVGGRAVLTAILPNGTRQILARAGGK